MNLAIGSVMHPRASARPASRSCIHVAHTNPVVVPMNAGARDLVKLFQLLAADLTYLAIRHLDLAVVT